MKTYSVIALLLMLSIGFISTSCKSEEHVETPVVAPLVIPNLNERVDNYLEDLLSVKNLEGDLLSGTAVAYYPNGNPQIKATFLDGIPNGEMVRYHENGNAELEISFEKGTPIGVQRIYYESGQLQSRLPIENGKYHGMLEMFTEEGYLYLQADYVEGLQHGDHKIFDKNGELIAWDIYENDKLLKTIK